MCIYMNKMRPSIRLGVTWSLNELKKLVNDENACVRVERSRKHISLHPIHLNDLSKAFQDILNSSINIYDHQFKGLLLAYKNPKLISELGYILHDSHFIHVDIEADFYIFEPQEQRILTGVVNKKANNYLGVLVHEVFNVSIPKKEDEEDWEGNHVEVGDDVTFIIEHVDLKGKLPYIRGKLLSSGTSKKHMSSTTLSHQFFNIDEESKDTFKTVNEEQNESKVPSFLNAINSNSSDEEAQTVNKGVKNKKHKISRKRNFQDEEEIHEKPSSLESTISTGDDDEYSSITLNGLGKSKKSTKKHKKNSKDKDRQVEDEKSVLHDDSTFNQSEDTSVLENGSPRKKSKKRKHENTEESSSSEPPLKIHKHKKRSKKNDDDEHGNFNHEEEKLFSQNNETETSQTVVEESITQKSKKKHKEKIKVEQNDFNEIAMNSISFISDFDHSLHSSQEEQPSKSSQKSSKHKNKLKHKIKEERPDSPSYLDNKEKNSQTLETEDEVNGITKSSQSDDNRTDVSFNCSSYDRDESQQSFNEFEKPTKSVKKKKRSSTYETVLAVNIKEEPVSDCESISSKKSKRKRKDRENTDNSLNNLDIKIPVTDSSQHSKKKDKEKEPVNDVSIGKIKVKQEVVIKEESSKKKKHRESNQSTLNIKQESTCSDVEGTAVKKKIKTLFTE